MLNRNMLVCLLGFVMVTFAKTGALLIEFEVTLQNHTLQCDKRVDNIESNQYSVMEGDLLYLKVNTVKYLNTTRCTILDSDNKRSKIFLNPHENYIMLKMHKVFSGKWECPILVPDTFSSNLSHLVDNNGDAFTSVICAIQLNVINELHPKIFINNIGLKLVRDTTSTEINFTGVYEYGDDDVFEVICRNTNVKSDGQLRMQYSLTDPSRRVYIANQSSHSEIGFRAKFTSRDHSSSIKCIYQNNEHARAGVQVKFMYRSNFDNLIRVKINGLTFRLIDPLYPTNNTHEPSYELFYTVYSDERVVLECEVDRNDLRLEFVNWDKINRSIVPTDPKRIEYEFTFKTAFTLTCIADLPNVDSKIAVEINFMQKPREDFRLNVDLPPENIVWALYESKNKKTIYYEFGSDMDLNVSCTATNANSVPFVYIQFGGSEAYENGFTTITTRSRLPLRNNSHIACYLKIQTKINGPSTADPVLQEIQIHFVKFDPTTSNGSGRNNFGDFFPSIYIFIAVGAIIVILVIIIITVKKMCCGKNRGLVLKNFEVFYLNLEIFRRQYEQDVQAQDPVYEEIDDIPRRVSSEGGETLNPDI